jgi:tetratricopeptide (TPR) repeat protein
MTKAHCCALTACLAASLLLAGCLTRQEQAESTTEQAMHYETNGQHAKAIELARLATVQDPANSHAWYWLGSACLGDKRYDEALAAFQKRTEMDQTGEPYLLSCGWLGHLYVYRTNRYAEAIPLLQKSLATTYPVAKAYFYDSLGTAYLNTGHTQFAIAAATEAVGLAPDNSFFTGHLQAANQRLGNPQIEDFVSPLLYNAGSYSGSIAIARWRTRMLITAKNQSLPGLLREGKTSDLASLATKIEQAIVDYAHESAVAKDKAQRGIETASPTANPQEVNADRELALVYTEKVEILKSILAAVKAELADRSK